MLYRPPNCPTNKLSEIIVKISDWKSNMERDMTPIIVMNGDFNLPFMGDWDEDRIAELLEKCSRF